MNEHPLILKPCPFCGGDNISPINGSITAPYKCESTLCLDCGASVPGSPANWNHRETPNLEQRLAKLEKFIYEGR